MSEFGTFESNNMTAKLESKASPRTSHGMRSTYQDTMRSKFSTRGQSQNSSRFMIKTRNLLQGPGSISVMDEYKVNSKNVTPRGSSKFVPVIEKPKPLAQSSQQDNSNNLKQKSMD